MPNKKQFWDYMVTLEIKVSATNREEAKQMITDDLSSLHILPENATIVRIRPIIKK